ncbi:MAG: homocysteine S-methyltransferase family protein [Pseudomonadota bacterium]
MSPYDQLIDRLRQGAQIVIDGATGTEVERRGVPQLPNAWNGGGALSHPDIVRQIHEDYILSGAEIIISNTFATTRHALRDAGEEDRFEAYNRRGVELAIEARARLDRPDVLVAGGISHWSWTGKDPSLADLGQGATEQAAIMAAAGADFLMLEMMIEIDRMLVTLEAAQRSGLPVWVGLSCERRDGGIALLGGAPLADALKALEGRDVPLINIMHTDVRDVDACLDVVESHWTGLTGVYAHTGDIIDFKWVFDDMISPEDYAAHSRRWLGRGISVIGGCCGIRPDHIAMLSGQRTGV